MRNRLGRALQAIGIVAIIGGIIYEILVRAEAGLLAITAGSLAFALGTKLVRE